MATTLIATYVNGGFKPDTPVDLAENTEVELTILAIVGVPVPEPCPPEVWETYLERFKLEAD